MQVPGWLNTMKRKRKSPKDQNEYTIDEEVISFTEKILEEYASFDPSHEGFVYWCGTRLGDNIHITGAIAPRTVSSPFRVSTDYQSNAEFVRTLSANKLFMIAQVHSHPGDWIDHSPGDDERAAFKFKGLLSIVVKQYGEKGMMPLHSCGVHRFDGEDFFRLTTAYVKKHFKIVHNTCQLIKDLRNE
jgi:hypothetical protein